MTGINLNLSLLRGFLAPSSSDADMNSTMPPHGSRTHPIHTIPTELLALIFKHTIQQSKGGHSVHFDITHLNSTFPARKLSSVCRRWRILAISTPDLWFDISIASLEPFRHSYRGWLDALKLHLERSKDSAFGIALTLDMNAKEILNLPPHFDLSGIIAPYSRRLRSLKVARLTPGMWATLRLSEASHLQSLSFTMEPGKHSIELNELTARSSFLKLREFSIGYAYPWPEPHQMQVCQSLQRHLPALPWHQITNLSLRLDYWNDIPATLLGCPAVTSLTVCLSGFEVTQAGGESRLPRWYTRDGDAAVMSGTTRKRVILSHVQELTLRIYEWIVMTPKAYIATGHLLEVISCPSLVSLGFEGIGNTGVREGDSNNGLSECLDALCGFLQSSGSGTLRRLSLENTPMNDDEVFLRLLHGPAMNGLEYLAIREPFSFSHCGAGVGNWLGSLIPSRPTTTTSRRNEEEGKVSASVPLPNLRDLRLALAVPFPLVPTRYLTAPVLLAIQTFESIIMSRTHNPLHSAVLVIPVHHDGYPLPDARGFAGLKELQTSTDTAIKVISPGLGVVVGYKDVVPLIDA
ncbi:hypothetical protein PQX77_012239 [Marasmius sp. AFHP31]|nr:hypothetical protein PQX77_012239 [Marasmius sp. AFHP31]